MATSLAARPDGTAELVRTRLRIDVVERQGEPSWIAVLSTLIFNRSRSCAIDAAERDHQPKRVAMSGR
jgi:hypothetical protein